MATGRAGLASLELGSTLQAELGVRGVGMSTGRACGTLGRSRLCGLRRPRPHGLDGLVCQVGKARSKGAANADAHAQTHSGAHETRGTAALVGRGALHDVHAALLLIGEPLAGTLPRKSLGLYVHLGGVALSLENARLANNLCLVERGKVILEGLDAVEREVVQRKAKGVKVSREPLLKQRRELAEIRRNLENRDAPSR